MEIEECSSSEELEEFSASEHDMNRDHENRDVPQATVYEMGTFAKVLLTLCLCASFFGLGLVVAMLGPTLLDLQQQTHSDTETISRLFIGRSTGYLIGSAVGGFLYDHFAPTGVMGVSLGLMGVATLAVPWCTTVLSLTSTIAGQGFTMGLVDTGGNLLCLHTWTSNSGPWMQTLHFAFGLGAFVAPLVAEPFLSKSNVSWARSNFSHRLHRDVNSIRINNTSNEVVYQHFLVDNHISQTLNKLYFVNQRTFQHMQDLPDEDPIENQTILDNFVYTGKKPQWLRVARSSPDQNNSSSKPISTGTTLSKNSKIANGSILKKLETSASDKSAEADSASEGEPETFSRNSSTLGTLTSPKTTPVIATDPTPTKTSSLTMEQSTSSLPPHQSSKNFVHRVTSAVSGFSDHVSGTIHKMSMLQFAFIVIAVYIMVVAVLCISICCWLGCRHKHTVVHIPETKKHLHSKGFRYQLLGLLFVFFFLYVGMEVTYGGLLFTYAVEAQGWSKAQGSLITAVFWGSFSAGRALAIPLSKFLSPAMMLVTDLILSFLALVGLALFVNSPMSLWILSGLLGISMASTYPSGITWAEQYMSITGKATAWLVVGSALGEMCIPAFTGYLFETKGPYCLMYVLLGATTVAAVMYVIMQNLASNSLQKYSGYNRVSLQMEVPDDPDEEFQTEANAPLLSRSDSDFETGDLGKKENKAFFENLQAKMKKKVTFNFKKNTTHNFL